MSKIERTSFDLGEKAKHFESHCYAREARRHIKYNLCLMFD